MSRIKGLALLVMLLGSAATFVTTPATAATRNSVQTMCLKYYCFYNGQCRYNPSCWANFCQNGCINP
jgi:hypothetical protein